MRQWDRTCDSEGAYLGLRRAQEHLDEWQRILAHVQQHRHPTYDPQHDAAVQEQQLTARRRQEQADHAAQAAEAARRAADIELRRTAGPAADSLYTALSRAGRRELTEEDHRAVLQLTQHLDRVTVDRVITWLEDTRTTAAALAAPPAPTRPIVRRPV
ncbi:hypothetical protein ACIG5E_38660 [Kitasatospora sp. NPDC053057]|uniref:hypothetical protein n=1 Tax=Kitasatospora sp. NPDC053057 TaxID=3364062 RepID=UPI0037C712AB